MSKQSEMKELQGYRTALRMCANCAHYRSEYAADWYGQGREGKKRCSLGGFAVQKTATCNMHEWGKK